MATPVVQEVYTYQLTGNTTTISHPVRDGANRYMLIDLPGRYASLTSATYGGTAVPAIPGADAGAGTAGTAHRHVNAAGLVAPPVGTASLVIVVSGNNQGTVRVRNMVDVDQSTPLRSQGGGKGQGGEAGGESLHDLLHVSDLLYPTGVLFEPAHPCSGATVVKCCGGRERSGLFSTMRTVCSRTLRLLY